MTGRIPQHFIDDLLDRIDIVEVIDNRIGLKKAGKNFKACCPFHEEKTPSFNVNPDKQFYHCFGCGAGGNAISFIMDYDKVDFPNAIESLANIAGLEVPREQTSPQDKAKQQRTKTLYETLNYANSFYQTQLRKHPNKQQAIDYLIKRGLSGEIARDFSLGYAPAGWDNLLSSTINTTTKIPLPSEKTLENAGLVIKKDNNQYYDRFRERIIFPIRDSRGRIIGFGGRVLGNDNPKYLNSPETEVFHKQKELYGLYEVRKRSPHIEYLLLVEGYMDVISLFQFGFYNAVATLGTASSSFHLDKIFRHTEKLVICFDGDEAGNKAALRLLDTALPAMKDGREITFLFLPTGEDPDTFIRQNGKPAFEKLIEEATPLEEMLVDSALAGTSLNSEAGKARFCQQALPLIKKLPNGIFKNRMLSRISELAGIEKDILTDSLKKLPTPSTKQATGEVSPEATLEMPGKKTIHQTKRADTSGKESPSPASFLNDKSDSVSIIWAISILMHHPEFATQTELPESLTVKTPELANNHYLLLLTQLHHYIQQQFKQHSYIPTTSYLMGHWHGEPEGELLTNCTASHEPPQNKHIALKEFKDALKESSNEINKAAINRKQASLLGKSPSQLSEEDKTFLLSIGKK